MRSFSKEMRDVLLLLVVFNLKVILDVDKTALLNNMADMSATLHGKVATKPGGQCLGFRCRQTGERGDVVEMDGAGEPIRAGGVVVVSVSNWGPGGI